MNANYRQLLYLWSPRMPVVSADPVSLKKATNGCGGSEYYVAEGRRFHTTSSMLTSDDGIRSLTRYDQHCFRPIFGGRTP